MGVAGIGGWRGFDQVAGQCGGGGEFVAPGLGSFRMGVVARRAAAGSLPSSRTRRGVSAKTAARAPSDTRRGRDHERSAPPAADSTSSPIKMAAKPSSVITAYNRPAERYLGSVRSATTRSNYA